MPAGVKTYDLTKTGFQCKFCPKEPFKKRAWLDKHYKAEHKAHTEKLDHLIHDMVLNQAPSCSQVPPLPQNDTLIPVEDDMQDSEAESTADEVEDEEEGSRLQTPGTRQSSR